MLRITTSKQSIAYAIAVATALTVVVEVVAATHVWSWFTARARIGCACGGVRSFTAIDGIAVGLTGIAAIGFVLGIAYGIRAILRTRRFVFAAVDDDSRPINGIVRAAAGGCGAFTFGLRRPTIAMCGHCADTLAPDEIAAVLGHEAHHVARRDPLRFLLLDGLAHALFFNPLLRQLVQAYRTAVEVEADTRVADQHALGRALLRMSDGGVPVAVAAFASVLRERMIRLVDPRWRLTIRLRGEAIVVAVFVAVTGVAIGVHRVPDIPSPSCRGAVVASCIRTDRVQSLYRAMSIVPASYVFSSVSE